MGQEKNDSILRSRRHLTWFPPQNISISVFHRYHESDPAIGPIIRPAQSASAAQWNQHASGSAHTHFANEHAVWAALHHQTGATECLDDSSAIEPQVKDEGQGRYGLVAGTTYAMRCTSNLNSNSTTMLCSALANQDVSTCHSWIATTLDITNLFSGWIQLPYRTANTAPYDTVVPSITAASNSMTPSEFGKPPFPT